MSKQMSSSAHEMIFQNLPLGLIIINEENHISGWNKWMEEKTGILTEKIIGNELKDVFPEINNNNRFAFALNLVLKDGSPQVLSQILNRYLVPIKIDQVNGEDLGMMQQHVELLPLLENGKRSALVVIQDVTHVVRQKDTLMQMAYKLEEETYHDALTGIYNRRFLWDWLDTQIEIARRENTFLICTMYDLDYFKSINDRYGHEAGDKVLIEFVKLVKLTLRASDIFVRYGGEEFITLMPGVNNKNVDQQYYRVQKLMEERKGLGVVDKDITTSAGISIWGVGNQVKSDSFISQADEALYRAKNSGRNCAFIFNDFTDQSC